MDKKGMHALVIFVVFISKVRWKISTRAAWLNPRDSNKNIKHTFKVFKDCLLFSLTRYNENLRQKKVKLNSEFKTPLTKSKHFKKFHHPLVSEHNRNLSIRL